MMGYKTRQFGAIGELTLEDLVPVDNFYRHLEQSLNLSFVRELVRTRYAALGRPSIDPVVFFKLHLVLFFEGIRSERQLERVGADRLSVRWYLGYDLHEPLPDHSSLTRIRDRYGISIFRQFFEAIVDRCADDGLIWGQEVFADATLVEANADRDKMLPRFAFEAHLKRLFGDAYVSPGTADATPETVSSESGAAAQTETVSPTPELSTNLSLERAAALEAQNQQRHDWYAHNGEPDRSVQRGSYQRQSDVWVSVTDPDAVLMKQHGHGTRLRYRDHYLVDGGKARIILGVLVTAADVMENMPFLDMLWRACFRWKLRPRSATGDTTYGTLEIIRALEDAGIRAYMPLPNWHKRSAFFGTERFTYDTASDSYQCPNGARLGRVHHNVQSQVDIYRAGEGVCENCPLRARCTDSKEGRTVTRSFHEEYLERVRGYHTTDAYKKAYQKRKVWVEPLFGEAQQWHGLRRVRLRGLEKVNCEGVMTATGQNLKRLLARRGWGRRHFPGGATGAHLPHFLRVLCA
jgi:transposase